MLLYSWIDIRYICGVKDTLSLYSSVLLAVLHFNTDPAYAEMKLFRSSTSSTGFGSTKILLGLVAWHL